MNKLFSIIGASLIFVPTFTSALNVPVGALLVSDYASGYVCDADSIGCSQINSVYEIEHSGENLYVCATGAIDGCSALNALFKARRTNSDTIHVCSGDAFGCSSFGALYELKKYSGDTTYVCAGDEIGCSSINALAILKKHDAVTTYACEGDSIGCSMLNADYKFVRKTSQQTYEVFDSQPDVSIQTPTFEEPTNPAAATPESKDLSYDAFLKETQNKAHNLIYERYLLEKTQRPTSGLYEKYLAEKSRQSPTNLYEEYIAETGADSSATEKESDANPFMALVPDKSNSTSTSATATQPNVTKIVNQEAPQKDLLDKFFDVIKSIFFLILF